MKVVVDEKSAQVPPLSHPYTHSPLTECTVSPRPHLPVISHFSVNFRDRLCAAPPSNILGVPGARTLWSPRWFPELCPILLEVRRHWKCDITQLGLITLRHRDSHHSQVARESVKQPTTSSPSSTPRTRNRTGFPLKSNLCILLE